MRAVRTLLFFSFMLFSGYAAIAGTPPPPPTTTTGGDPSCWPPPCVPVDGGIGLLMAAGVAYGAKKFYGRKKSGNNRTQRHS